MTARYRNFVRISRVPLSSA